MLERLEFAKRQALAAHATAFQCGNGRPREEWSKVARMWDDVAHEYERLLKINALDDPPQG
jgi:hypothetical protein